MALYLLPKGRYRASNNIYKGNNCLILKKSIFTFRESYGEEYLHTILAAIVSLTNSLNHHRVAERMAAVMKNNKRQKNAALDKK